MGVPRGQGYDRDVLALLVAAALVSGTQEVPPRPIQDRSVSVHVTDGQGGLLIEGWRVFAVFQDPGAADPRAPARREVPVDAGTGTAEFTGLPAANVQLGALGPDRQRAPAKVVDLVVAAHLDVELVAQLVDHSRAVRAEIRAPALGHVQPAAGTVFAVGMGGVRHPMQYDITRAPFAWRVDGLEPGEYTVAVDDPRFLVARSEPVRAGATARLDLVGAGAVRLTAVDVITGDTAPEFWVDTRQPGYTGVSFARRGPFVALPGDGVLLDGMLADDVELEVLVPGRTPCVLRPPRLERGVTPRLHAEVGRVVTAVARVVDEAGAPVAHARVMAFRGPHPGHDNPSIPVVVGGPHPARLFDAETVTDASGEFRLEGLAADLVTFTIERGPFAFDHVTRDLAGGDAGTLTLTLPVLGAVDIDVVLPQGAVLDALRVGVVPRGRGEGFLSALRRPREAPVPGRGLGALRLWLHADPSRHTLELREVTTDPRGGRTVRVCGERAVDVVAGQVVRATLDARVTAPVLVTLRSDVLGEDAAWLSGLGLIAATPGVPPSRNPAEFDPAAPGAAVTATLRRRLGPYLPFAVGPGWFHEAVEPLELAALDGAPIEVTLALAPRTYVLVDASGRPIAETPVTCRFDGGGRAPGAPIIVTTDASGRLRVLGPMVPLRFAAANGAGATVEHTSGAPATIVIKPRG